MLEHVELVAASALALDIEWLIQGPTSHIIAAEVATQVRVAIEGREWNSDVCL
jgi:hypothetical protein